MIQDLFPGVSSNRFRSRPEDWSQKCFPGVVCHCDKVENLHLLYPWNRQAVM